MRCLPAAAAILFCVFTSHLAGLSGQETTYEATWESIDSRPTPQWWRDAKFGIFIFWGVSAVPAYSPPGTYTEWYWHFLEKSEKWGPSIRKFQDKAFGEGIRYEDFVPLWKAEFFDPEKWAEVVERSGAKYVVLNAKHHDGYTLWRSEEADRSYGRKWNSVDSGPGRDIIAEVASAVRGRGLKFGVYYSIYEWFNPFYLDSPETFVQSHYFPQFKDLVSHCAPSVIFADGEWDHGDEIWKSRELLAWLFNRAPNREEVVVNDRWFKGCRHTHGGYYTTEYGSGFDSGEHPWEENRAIGESYGYNRAEELEHYSTARELILMLVDIVSRGGNLLLDIGPAADGRIPVIMEDRLEAMGRWLAVNGEAIYGSRPWKVSCQWGPGQVPDEPRGEYNIAYDVLRLTLEPEDGQAVKEVFFTRKDDSLYAITPRFPHEELVLRGIKSSPDTHVSLLGISRALSWTERDGNLVIRIPSMPLHELPCRNAWAFKITGIGSTGRS